MNCTCGKTVPEPMTEGWTCPNCGRRLTLDDEGWARFERPYHFEEGSLEEAVPAARRPARAARPPGLGWLGAALSWGGCIFVTCVGYVVLRSREGELRVDWHKFSASEWALAVGLGALAGLVLQASYVLFRWVWGRGRGRGR